MIPVQRLLNLSVISAVLTSFTLRVLIFLILGMSIILLSSLREVIKPTLWIYVGMIRPPPAESSKATCLSTESPLSLLLGSLPLQLDYQGEPG